MDDIERVTAAVNPYTQTVGIYPESLKRQLHDTLPLFGAQRLTSLGYACHVATAMPGRHRAGPPHVQVDVDETCDPAVVPPMWGSLDVAVA